MTRELFAPDPTIGYRFIRGLRARVPHEGGGYLIRTNAQGFRCDHDFAPEPVPSRRRALLFGDSFTAGDGVSNGKRYGDLLESLVPDLEVYNFGLPGSGTDQQYLAWESFGRPIAHDLLIISVLVENIRRVASKYRFATGEDGRTLCQAKPWFELVDERLELRGVPVPPGLVAEGRIPASERVAIDRGGRFPRLRDAVRRAGLRELAQKLTRYQPLPEYDDPKGRPWRTLRAILERWIAADCGPVLLVPLPLQQHIEGNSSARSYQERFREVAAGRGCRLHDPLPDLAAYSPDERRQFRFEHDVHLTLKGHEALARSLAPAVEAMLPARSGGFEQQ